MPDARTNCGSVITAGCLFSGIGGFCEGLARADVRVLWANENDGYAAETYRANYPQNRLIEKDVRDLSVIGDRLDAVDILTAGFPCQSFSQAGDRKGFDDERGTLFFEIVRLIREFGERKPRILLLENVPYLQYGKGGVWFEKVLREIQLAGYWLGRHNFQVLNTAEITSLPHRRERLFMTATATNAFPCNDFQFPAPNENLLALHKIVNKRQKPSADHYMETDNRYCKAIARKMAKGDEDSIYQLRRSYARENKNECPPLTANMGGGGHNVPFIKDRWGIRKLTVEECAKFQGFDEIRFPKSVPIPEQYKQIGNAVSVPVAAKLARECVQTIMRSGAQA